MERVIGIGGVFFRARDAERLRAWYGEHLGLVLSDWGGCSFRAGEGDVTVWAAFPHGTEYFGPVDRQLMVNYRVRDLDAMLAQLRAGGVEVDERLEESDYGRFGWARDCEGNRIELWEPPERYPDD